VKDNRGNIVFSDQKDFHVGDLYFKGGKQVAMAEWDITATEHFDLGLKALETDSHTYIIPLKEDLKNVTVEAEFRYLYTRDKTFSLQKAAKEVVIEKY
jgi:hypothetical protein